MQAFPRSWLIVGETSIWRSLIHGTSAWQLMWSRSTRKYFGIIIYICIKLHVDFSSLFRCPWPRKSKVTPSTWWLDPMRAMAIHAIRNWSIIRPETFLKLDAGTGEQNVNKGSSVFCFFATMCGLRGRNSSAKTRKTNANTCKRAQI